MSGGESYQPTDLTGDQRGLREARAALTLIRRLAGRLQEEGVSYCHWKSNEALDRSLTGDNDLDLLVAEQDVPATERVLEGLGFLPAHLPAPRRVPGVQDHLGLDEETGRLVHVQVHTGLVLGDDMTKNFRIPVEAAYLASRRAEGVLPVPAPEFEYVVFLLRMAVKHCPLDAIAMGKGRLTHSERRELDFLTRHLDASHLQAVLRDHFPWLEAGTLDMIRGTLRPNAPVLARAAAGRRVLSLLGPFGRRSRSADLLVRTWRRLIRRSVARPDRGAGYKTPGRTGAVLAVVGGDGAGKSSLVAALFERLGSQFRTARIHMGKPPRGLASRVVRRLLRALRLDTSAGGLPAWSSFEGGFPGLAHMIGNTLVARDRFRQAREAEELAERGYLVLSDRWPIPGLSTMDTVRNGRIAEKFPSATARLLDTWERRFHDAIPDPDLTLVLVVSPATAVARRPEQDEEFVRTRAEEIARSPWENPAVRVVDADAPPDVVLRQALAYTWEWLTEREGTDAG